MEERKGKNKKGGGNKNIWIGKRKGKRKEVRIKK